MAKTLLKNLQDCEDFSRGCTFFGTGGGGDYATGVALMMEQLNAGKEVGWIDLADLPDDAYTACPFGMGSLAPITDKKRKQMDRCELEGLGKNRGYMLAAATRELEAYTGKKISGLVPIEQGGRNCGSALAAAAINGIVAVDGDYVGRAIPEINQIIPAMKGKSLLPLVSSDAWGNVTILKKTLNQSMTERIGKYVGAAAFNGTGMSGMLMSKKETDECILHGSLTKSLKLGRLIRETREAGGDPVKAAADFIGGWVLVSECTVTKKEWWEEDGYYYGFHTLKKGNDAYKTMFKNETHLFWKNGTLLATSPDLLICVDPKTGEPFSNPEPQEGTVLSIIGGKCSDFYRAHAIEILGPRNFGEDVDYVPIEKNFGK